MSDLTIPDSAYAAAYIAVAEVQNQTGVMPRGRGAIAPIIGASARLIVAAELRRLAAEDESEIERLRYTASCYSNGLPVTLRPIFDRHHTSMMRLRARADELDGGTP